MKPQNVLVAEDGHLKVTDFGIARAGAETDMTEAGSVIGTAQYLSPEQARGDEVTAASDCYAVGIVLYEMLTGRVPFDGGPPVAVAMKQISDEPVSPRIVEPSVPRELEAVVLRSLAKRPSERYRTAEEMSRALAEARAAIDGTGGTTRVMGAAAAGGTTGQMTAATRVAAPPPTEPPAPPPARLGDHRRACSCCSWWRGVGAAVLLSGGDSAQADRPGRGGTAGAQARADPHRREVRGGRAHGHRRHAWTRDSPSTRIPPRGDGRPRGRHRRPARERRARATPPCPTSPASRRPRATAQLSAAGFEVKSQTRASAQVAEGLVISQQPDAATHGPARQHRHDHRLERRRRRWTCPDVTGQSQSGAEQTLRDAGLVPSASTAPSDRPARGDGHLAGPRAAARPTGAARSTSWWPPRRPTSPFPR